MNRRRAAKNKIIMMIFVKNNYPCEQVRENTDNKFVVYFHTIIYISFFQDFFNRYNSFFFKFPIFPKISMVLSMIIGNSFWKFCSAEKPMFKGQPFLRMKRLKHNFLSCGQVSSTQKNRKKILLNIDKNDSWSCIPCCYHAGAQLRGVLGYP